MNGLSLSQKALLISTKHSIMRKFFKIAIKFQMKSNSKRLEREERDELRDSNRHWSSLEQKYVINL
jgi:hypothetical protein